MNKKFKAIGLLGLTCFLLISACAPAARAPAIANEQAVAPQPPAMALPTMAPPANLPVPDVSIAENGSVISGAPANGQMIIKNAEIDLLVQDTDIAIDRITQIVDDVGGYIVSSKSWFEMIHGENKKLSTLPWVCRWVNLNCHYAA